MEKLTLQANARTPSTKGALTKLRQERRVPGIIYGLKEENVLIDFPQNKFEKCIGGNRKNKVIEIDVNGKIENVLVREITRDPVRQFDISHVDFIRVNDSHPVIVNIPILHSGVPVGVKNEGGFFQIMKKFIKVKCKIGDIPEGFTMDVSELHSGDVVYARDFSPENAEVLTPGKTALYGVSGRAGGKLKEDEAGAPASEAAADSKEAAAPESAETEEAKA